MSYNQLGFLDFVNAIVRNVGGCLSGGGHFIYPRFEQRLTKQLFLFDDRS